VNREITGSARDGSITDLSETTTELLGCPNPVYKLANPVYATYNIWTKNNQNIGLPETVWMLGRAQADLKYVRSFKIVHTRQSH
jgi:hypothetical protein